MFRVVDDYVRTISRKSYCCIVFTRKILIKTKYNYINNMFEFKTNYIGCIGINFRVIIDLCCHGRSLALERGPREVLERSYYPRTYWSKPTQVMMVLYNSLLVQGNIYDFILLYNAHLNRLEPERKMISKLLLNAYSSVEFIYPVC